MSRNHDNRSGSPNGFEDERPADRRASCRYSVDQVPAVLGWYDPNDVDDQPPAPAPAPVVETAAEPPPPPPKVFDTTTYSAIMARGPALRGGPQSPPPPAAAKPPAQPPTAGFRNGNGHGSTIGFGFGKSHLAGLANGKPTPAEPPPAAPVAPPPRESTDNRAAAAAKTGESSMQTCQARIIDVSQTGVSLVCEAVPNEGQPAWIRLEGVDGAAWIEGNVCGISQRDPGRFLVRLAFRDGCPYDFFKATVWGGSGQ